LQHPATLHKLDDLLDLEHPLIPSTHLRHVVHEQLVNMKLLFDDLVARFIKEFQNQATKEKMSEHLDSLLSAIRQTSAL
jgi:hypothetical protein